MPPKKPIKKKTASGYKMPDPIPAGEVVRSNTKEVWTVGKSIGVGGFGEIYLCSAGEARCSDNATLAMKIEPHENGPLFVEMNFYLRTAKQEMIEDFRKKRSLKSFGMPVLRGSGNHLFKGDKYRFLVMDRYSKDIDKFFQGGKQVFSEKTAFILAVKILDTIEYIHSKGYVHNDIKAQNLMMGYGNGKENDVYLVDFGLVSKYHRGENQTHIDYKPDPRFAHDGTIEYLSRDSHNGIKGRRSDLEILGYNLVHWMSGHLPWLGILGNAKAVQAKKEEFMSDITGNLKKCFGNQNFPNALKEFLNYVINLEFQEEPSYNICRAFFQKALKSKGNNVDDKLDFNKNSPAKPSPTKRVGKRKETKPNATYSSDEFIIDDSGDLNISDISNGITSKKKNKHTVQSVKSQPSGKTQRKLEGLTIKVKKPTYKESASQTSPNFVKTARAAAKVKKAAALARSNEMEEFAEKAKAAAINAKIKTPCKFKTSDEENVENNISMDNPTPAMLELMRKKEAAKLEKSVPKRKPVLSKISNTPPRSSKKSRP